MKEIIGFRHVEGSDYGTFENKEGKEQSYDNIALLCIDKADTDWYGGKPTIEKVPMELVARSLNNLDTTNLAASLIGKFCIIEKESKLVTRNGAPSLNEKVVGIYFL